MLTAFPGEPDTELVKEVEGIFSGTVGQVRVVEMPPKFKKAARRISASKPAKIRSGSKRKAVRRHLQRRQNGHACFYCGVSFTDTNPMTTDHLIPNSIVHSWVKKNLVQACEDCNSTKGERVPAVLMPLLAAVVVTQACLIRQARENEGTAS